ncbi:hypothetical protein M378DRAFT_763720 [Amanita muscaria Koide BX008]|uniref:Uncharacterized protein n=1 Tax=Amanita muscaria (strain Koide BX008) TaxID=946122 RepID=A0A0C2X4A5_AMAMK|nr:hypothetical protein M378DRAFT_763720 [Amanita muscaria Koide BX008]
MTSRVAPRLDAFFAQILLSTSETQSYLQSQSNGHTAGTSCHAKCPRNFKTCKSIFVQRSALCHMLSAADMAGASHKILEFSFTPSFFSITIISSSRHQSNQLELNI